MYGLLLCVTHEGSPPVWNSTEVVRKQGLTNRGTYVIIPKHERKCQYRGVEQLVARRAHNPEVVGSSPASATKKENSHLYGGCFRFLFRVRFKFTPEGYEPLGE